MTSCSVVVVLYSLCSFLVVLAFFLFLALQVLVLLSLALRVLVFPLVLLFLLLALLVSRPVRLFLASKQLLEGGEIRLILDLNKNVYSSTGGWWAAAEKVSGMPLLYYTDLIEGAEEIHMIESSVYCLASHLDLSNVKRKVCYKPWGGNAERLGVFETGNIKSV